MGGGTASSPLVFINKAYYGDEPSPLLLADFLELNFEPKAPDFFVIAPSEPGWYPTIRNSSRPCHTL